MLSTVPLTSARGLDTRVSELVHSPYIAVPPEAPLEVVARTLSDFGIHAVLVRDHDHGPLGWVTTRGMLHNHPRDWTDARAGDAITEHVATVAPGDTVAQAIDAFIASGASHLLVAETPDAWPLGVLADSDLVTHIARPAG